MTITATKFDSVLLLQMDDGRVNAINTGFCDEFAEALELAKGSDAVVLTGRQAVFSAGLDLRALCGASAEALNQLFLSMSSAMESVFKFPKPIIAACSGHAIGGGAVLMLGCDERLGDSSGRYHIHATGLGIPYPTAVLEIVTVALGPSNGQRSLLLGDPVRGSCRQREGWIHGISQPQSLIDDAIKRAQKLSTIDPNSFANTKQRLRAEAFARIAANKESDAQAFVERVCSDETQARITTAVEKLQSRKNNNIGAPQR